MHKKRSQATKTSLGSGRELGVAGRREFAFEIFDDVEGEAADQRDHRHFPQKRPSRDVGQVQESSKRHSAYSEVLVEEGERGEVAAQTEELGQHHEPVPGADRQRHHQELGENERREGDGHDVKELRLEQHQGAVHQDATLVNAD